MRKIKRKKGYAGKMQEKIFERIRMNEIIEKKKKSDIKLKRWIKSLSIKNV